MSRSTFDMIIPSYSLRHYQRETVLDAMRIFKSHDRVLLHAPTGSGKTRMAMAIVTQHMRENGPTLVLWLAPSSELIDQAYDAFKEAWKSHGDIDSTVIQWWGEGESFSHAMSLDRNTMLVTGLQMATRAVDSVPEILPVLQEKATLIVFDEAHQSVAPGFRALVENILKNQERKCLLLGLSATPGRASTTETQELADMYEGRKVVVAPGQNPVTFLVNEGFLAKANIQIHNIHDTPPPSNQGDKNEHYASSELKYLGELDHRNLLIVEQVRNLVNNNHLRIIAFTPSVASAEWCAKRMKQEGVKYSNAVIGNMRQDSRDHILNTFRVSVVDNPNPQVIFNCRALTAGVDLPETSGVVIGHPTKSFVLLQQMIGRALRGPKSGGNANADISILADESYKQFVDLATLFVHWDELWEPA